MEGKGIQCDFEVKQGFRERGFEWFELDPARVKQVVSHSFVTQSLYTLQLTSEFPAAHQPVDQRDQGEHGALLYLP
jgi:hypothetical protein